MEEQANAQANASNGKRPRSLTTPKQSAEKRLDKLRAFAEKTAERMRGYQIDSEMRELVANVDVLKAYIRTLPDDFKPKRSARQGPTVAEGQSFRLKPDAVKKYRGRQGDVDTFEVIQAIDSVQVLVNFTDGIRAVVKRADIGDRIA